jgi:DNA-binding GntR family transcriptional regulator
VTTYDIGAIRQVRRVRLMDEVTHHLRDLILSGALPPGQQLLQIQLAEQLGVSRTPLREAFRVLERDGLIRTSNGNKTVEVVEMTTREMEDLYELREVLDGLAARRLARLGLADEVREELAELLTEMERASDPLDTAAYSEAHQRFHELIIHAAGNQRLTETLPVVSVTTQMLLTRRIMATAPGTDPNTNPLAQQYIGIGNKDHRELFTALAEQRAKDAEAIARQHDRATARTIARMAPVEETVQAAAS